MSSDSKTARPLWLPPPDLSQRKIPKYHQPPHVWYRVHHGSTDAVRFQLKSHHRFSHPDCPFPILYLGADPATCLWEPFGDLLFHDRHALPYRLWAATVLTAIHVPALALCDLTSNRIRSAMSVDRSALMSRDFEVTHAWALALQCHPSNFQGLRYSSRFISRPCVALFARNDWRDHLKIETLGSLQDQVPAARWLDQNKVNLI